ncbi:peroxisome assembly protein (Peroxin-2) [Coemansia sp. RSA 989]|nr:peroxisomal biogenesis factor 2 [Coemansia mojavensis]KAJ1743033.1 peroxisome assembly protein (Peroxin-2) [Coemansia sp. RSA 1086]KAJ1751175.1 peroxisome assembly protein (Peroxin-2) [Coemansia sp. RSA 1821]KAJ1864263.1 peroxisome assembly protein (Peroxin-2) [Coemansia sp. RSA 989]KAJ2627258.1 peroxisome assembly protein (Peroxin-2) [Coemansia sp. RSA 1290]KAJ2676292.1 peroxisome assembly protein (Peroxin-2) [Coemansia sp. RSA 1085]
MSANEQPWTGAWIATLARVEPRLAKTPAPVVPRNARVSKLDSELLDSELADIIREPVSKSLSLLRPGLVEKYRLEMDTAIRALLFWLSVGSSRRATYGQGLQNLRYADIGRGFSRRIRLLGLLTVGGPYVWAKLLGYMSLNGWADAPPNSLQSRIWRLLQRIERAAKIAAVVNFAAFLSMGQYRTLVERMLGLRLVNARPQLAHSVSFEFLNRQLVWHAFTEFVMFAMPLINPSKARAWVVRNMRGLLRLPASVDPEIKALPEDVCAVCFVQAKKTADEAVESADDASIAVNPYETNCGHRYCYVCISTKMLAEADECLCLRCGTKVDRIFQALDCQT